MDAGWAVARPVRAQPRQFPPGGNGRAPPAPRQRIGANAVCLSIERRTGPEEELMTEPTDTFAELSRRGHEVFTAAIRAWEQAARSMVEAARRPDSGRPDPRASLDAAFDFAAQMLAEQRDFAKALLSAGSKTVASAAQRAKPSAAPEATTGPGARAL